MIILIAGASGVLGREIFKRLSNFGFEVYRINRFNETAIFFEYHIQNPFIPVVKIKYDVIINCAYNYNDKRLDDRNINLIINQNLIAFSKKNNIPLFINISSMSAFEGCLSSYGNIKLLIEKKVALNNGYSFRLGLFEDKHPVGLIKNILEINKIIPFFSLGVKNNNLPQYITNLDKLSKFLESFLKNEVVINPDIYSLVNSQPLEFNEIIFAVTKKPPIKIPVLILKLILFIYELLPLPKLRFNLDSLKGLLFPVKQVKNLIHLERF